MMGHRRAQRVGRYHLLDRVACGGMAEVYRAKLVDADGTEHLIGLKKVLDMYSTDRNFLRMLVAEYHLSALLHHPNIAEIYELIRVPEGYFIAMEYVDGKDLRGSMLRAIEQNRGFDVNDAAFLMARALDGLDHAHRATTEDGTPLHLVHRDFSPSNVLIGYDGSVKIIDFGIAKAAVPRDQTAAGIIKGKVRYMSPEQANGDQKLTAQSDVFSAGSCLYELLGGKPAFNAPNELEMIYAVRRAQPVPLEQIAPHVPEAMVAIVRKAMARSRRERYRTAAEFRDALLAYMRAHAAGYRRTRLANFMRLLWEVEIDLEISALLEFAISDEPAVASENLLAGASMLESLEAAGFSQSGEVLEPQPSGPYPTGPQPAASEEPETRAIARSGSNRAAKSPAPGAKKDDSAAGRSREAQVVHSNRRAQGLITTPKLTPHPAPTLTGLETVGVPASDTVPPPPMPLPITPEPLASAGPPRPRDAGGRAIARTPAAREKEPSTQPIELEPELPPWEEKGTPPAAKLGASAAASTNAASTAPRVPRPSLPPVSIKGAAPPEIPRPPQVPRLDGGKPAQTPSVAPPVPRLVAKPVEGISSVKLQNIAQGPVAKTPALSTAKPAPAAPAHPPAVPRPRASTGGNAPVVQPPRPSPANAPPTIEEMKPIVPAVRAARQPPPVPAPPTLEDVKAVAPPRPKLGARSAPADEREPVVPGVPRLPGAPKAPAPEEATFADTPKKR